jgi:hypothetical protein
MSKNTEGAGAAQAKSGDQALPLDRGMGISQTMGAMGSKTRSPHNSAGGPNYKYQEPQLSPVTTGDACCDYTPKA